MANAGASMVEGQRRRGFRRASFAVIGTGKPDAWSAAIFWDKFDASCFKRATKSFDSNLVCP